LSVRIKSVTAEYIHVNAVLVLNISIDNESKMNGFFIKPFISEKLI